SAKDESRLFASPKANGSTGISSSHIRKELRTAVRSQASAASTFDFPEAFGPKMPATGTREAPNFGKARTSGRSSTATIYSCAGSSIERKFSTSNRMSKGHLAAFGSPFSSKLYQMMALSAG